jgi:hypothetical protein
MAWNWGFWRAAISWLSRHLPTGRICRCWKAITPWMPFEPGSEQEGASPLYQIMPVPRRDLLPVISRSASPTGAVASLPVQTCLRPICTQSQPLSRLVRGARRRHAMRLDYRRSPILLVPCGASEVGPA